LLHDLFGSEALLRAAGSGLVPPERMELLYRPWSGAADRLWTTADAPLLDEARGWLGFRPGRKAADDIRTYGHIVVDEAQDLSPMELRMLSRRSLNGSMTIVGDIAQSTSAWAHDEWGSVLEHLPQKKPHRDTELTVGYRIPQPLMDLAGRVLTEAAPNLQPARSVRTDGDPPRIVSGADIVGDAIAAAGVEHEAIGAGSVALIVPRSLVDPIEARLAELEVDFGRATRSGLDQPLTVVPVALVKGLEVDAAVVVEPARIVREEPQGMRSLYVALTRATKRLAVVHSEPLPQVLS
ncbi:MAG: ATP-binding domain-containing protein, partial [Acidimicrobiales bacterium]|nr:ATP-binding domain-containing protein [Acidimicrobiales bacterium]